MKKMRVYFMLPLLMMVAMCTMVSCDDPDYGGSGTENNGDGGNENGGGDISDLYFDVWVELDSTGNGMNSGATMVVNSVESLSDVNATIDFDNEGADVSSKLHDESLIKDGYYYQIPQTEGRFGKYKICDNKCETIKEIQLPEDAMLAARKYCGDWIDDDTLVIMGSINSYQDVAWVKINTTTMKILGSGVLALDTSFVDDATGYKFSTSGLVRYREADDRLIYSYSVKRDLNDTRMSSSTSIKSFDVDVAFIDPSDMSIEKTITDNRVEQTSGTAFGELLQTKTFFDDKGDYYILCTNVAGCRLDDTNKYESGFIRINAGTTEFDTTYFGLFDKDEKICSFSYLGGEEIVMYAQNPSETGASTDDGKDGWDSSSYNGYYSVVNFVTGVRTSLTLDGVKLAACSGSLSTQYFDVADGKAYLGMNTEDYTGVYLYDIVTKSISEGSPIASGYNVLRIVAHE